MEDHQRGDDVRRASRKRRFGSNGWAAVAVLCSVEALIGGGVHSATILLIYPAAIALFPAFVHALVELYNPELRGPVHPGAILLIAAIPALAAFVARFTPLL